MNLAKNIRRILLVAGWIVLASAILVLLVAAINRKNARTCKSFRVEINDGKPHVYVDRQSVIDLLTENGKRKLTGQPIVSFDLKDMEARARKNVWIKDAQVFFDNNETLRIRITEREPIARILTVNGISFLMDSDCVQLPLPSQHALRLPLVTGFPHDRIRATGADSSLVQGIKILSIFLRQHSFWMADIEQISIAPGNTFQMVPAMGNHIIEFGDAKDCGEKFHRLLVFYREVSARTSFDRYSKLDLRYAGQVIGTKRGSNLSAYDSLLAIRKIQELIRSSQEWKSDTLRQENVKPLEHNTLTEQSLTGYDIVTEEEDSSSGKGARAKEQKKTRP